jgi:hypothetical protein
MMLMPSPPWYLCRTDVNGQRAPQCLPLGGQSVWGAFGGAPKAASTPTILLTAGEHGWPPPPPHF